MYGNTGQIRDYAFADSWWESNF